MVGIVLLMEHHSLAHAQLDLPVTTAKSKVNFIFKKVLAVFFLFPFSIPEIILTDSAIFVKFKICLKIR